MKRRVFLGLMFTTTAAVVVLFTIAVMALGRVAAEGHEVALVSFGADVTRSFEDDGVLIPDPVRTAGVYSPEGVLIDGEGPMPPDRAVIGALEGATVHDDGDNVMIVAIPMDDGMVMRVEEPNSLWRGDARRAMIEVALVSLAVLFVAFITAALIARRFTGKVAALADTAKLLGEGDFLARAEMSGMPELDEVATTLNHTADQLGRLVERERRLTADLAHQLRTPVAGMRLALEAEMEAPRDDHRVILDELIDAVDRLDAVSTSLVTLYRDGTSHRDSVDVGERVHAAIDRWHHQVVSADRALALTPFAEAAVLAPVRAGAIDAALDVLIDNALVHGTGAIRVSCRAEPHGIHIVVQDDGTFVRHAPTDSMSHGVGLSLADAVVSAEGGSVQLVSMSPTRFDIMLPLAD